MFNNSDPLTNGESSFYEMIRPSIKTIFDVGCRSESLFLDFTGEVHYFDPVEEFIYELKQKQCLNKNSFFNVFGLSDTSGELLYHPGWQSFHKRNVSCNGRLYQYHHPTILNSGSLMLKVRAGRGYMNEKTIDTVDFMKIDTEGHEFNVIKGLDIEKIKIIQFEYGGCYLDTGIKLNDVVKYLTNHGFDNINYLEPYGLTPISKIKEMKSSDRAIQLGYPEKVFIEENGEIPDHYNYCNIVAFNKNLL